jgi:hypothetical protein
MDKQDLLLPNIPSSGLDDDSIFFDEQTPISSMTGSRNDNPSYKTFKDDVYKDVKGKSKKGFNFKWRRKGKKDKKNRMKEAEESLNRTTLRKTLGNTRMSARGRHSRYTGDDEKDIYCNLI